MENCFKRIFSLIAVLAFFASGISNVFARPRTSSSSSSYSSGGYGYDDYYGYGDDYGYDDGYYGYDDGYYGYDDGYYGYDDGYYGYDDGYYGDGYGYDDGYYSYSDDDIDALVDELYSIIEDFLFDYEPDYEYSGSDWDEEDYSGYSNSEYEDDDDYYGGSSNTPSHTAGTSHPSSGGSSGSSVPTTTVSNQRKQFVEYALSLRGTPYVYGGKTPNPGMDCSGFVAFAARKAINVNFTGSAQNMYNNSSKVSTDKAEPGDLLFFSDNGSSISHVGIYLGRNGMGGNNDRMFVHSASEGSSTGVIVSSLDKAGYWSRHFVGMKSFLPSTSTARSRTRSKGLNPITSLQSSKKEFAKDKWWKDVDESWFKD
jgi:cell wall-associated NlpC family hydrolase